MSQADTTPRSVLTTDQRDRYWEDGFLTPFSVFSKDEAEGYRSELEQIERDWLAADLPLPLNTYMRVNAHLVIPLAARIALDPRVLDVVQGILGPDIMVWSAEFFIKEARTTHTVGMHQDLTYWGLDDAEEATCWVALSPVTKASGCMRFVPGSHKKRIVAHVDTYDDNNMLSRGQEIAVDVDEDEAVLVELQPGQASLHHGHLFHASGPNTTNDRRIGVAIRYIKPSMKQQSGDKSLVAHVSGTDRFGHFNVAQSPKDRLQETDFDLCRRDAEIKRRVLYEGADASRGKRY